MYAKVLHDKKTKSFKRVTNNKTLAFLAMYYYMGLVKCSSRADYWKKSINWPHHPPTDEISRDRFDFVWRHIHLEEVTTVDDIDDSIPEVDNGELIGEEEDVVEVETVNDDTSQDNKRPPTAEEVEKNKKW